MHIYTCKERKMRERHTHKGREEEGKEGKGKGRGGKERKKVGHILPLSFLSRVNELRKSLPP